MSERRRPRKRFSGVARTSGLVGLVAALSASCGAPRGTPLALRPPAERPVATPSAAPSEPPVTAARASSEALVAAGRPDAILAWVAKLLPAGDAASLERALGVPSGALGDPGTLERLGVDRAGEVTLESFELDASAAAEIARVAKLDRDAPDAELGEALVLESKRALEGFMLTRVRIPTKPDGALHRFVEATLERSRASRWQVAGDLSVFGREGTIWVLRDVPGALEIGVALGRHELRGAVARGALGALSAWSDGAKVALDGDDLAIVLHPRALSFAGAWLGVMRAAEVSFGDAIEPDMSRRLLLQGFREATESLRLDAPSGAPRYASTRLGVRGGRVVLTSSLAEGESAFDAAAWRASTDATVAGARSFVSVNGALAYAWPLLPPTNGLNPFRGGATFDAMREAGFPGLLLALGDAPFLSTRLAIEAAEPIGRATLPFLRRFERLGVSLDKPALVHVGLLVATATEEQAACALAAVDDHCAKGERVPSVGALSLRGFFVERRRIDGRWVLLASRDRAALDKAKIDLVHGERPPLEAVIDVDAVLARRALGRYRVEVKLGGDGRSFEATGKPAP